MKILMVCDFYAEDQLYQDYMIAKYYMKLGHTVVVVTSTYTNIFELLNNKYDKTRKASVSYSNMGVKLYRFPYSLNILHKIKKFPSILKVLIDEAPDLIFSHGQNFNLNDIQNYIEKFPKTKHIMDWHADYSNSGKNWLSINVLHKLIRKKYLDMYKHKIDQFYAITPNTQKFLSEVYDIAPHRIELLPLGYDKLAFAETLQNENNEKIRLSFGISPDEFVIISGGKFNPLKKTEILIDAIKQLNIEKIKVLIFGTAEKGMENYEEELRKKAEGLNVDFCGWLNNKDTLRLLSVADLAVFPSSQSVLWQQCIGAGLPLLVGDSGNQNVQYLNKNNNIIQIGAQDINVSVFSSEIEKMYSDRKMLEDMKNGAEKTARDFLDYEEICKKTLKVFEN